jgi:hypothetical protein
MRFSPPWLVQLVLLAMALDACLQSDGLLRWIGTAALGLGLVVGITSAVRLVTHGQPASWSENLDLLVNTKGYDYGGWLAKVWPRLSGTDEERLEALRQFDEPRPELLRAELAEVAWKFSSRRDALLRHLRAGEADSWPQYALGLGAWALEQGRKNPAGSDLERALSAAREQPAPIDLVLAKAVGRMGGGRAFGIESFAQQVREAIALSAPPAYFEGLGMRAHRWLVLAPYGEDAFRMRPQRLREAMLQADPTVGADLVRGLEQDRSWRRMGDS